MTTKTKGKYHCCICGKDYNRIDYFPKSQSRLYKGNNGCIPICLTCIDKEVEYYKQELGDEKKAIQRVCLHWDIYYRPEIYTIAVNAAKNKSVMHAYLSKVKLKQWSGRTYDTTLSEENENLNSLSTKNNDSAVNQIDIEEEIQNLDPKRTIGFWGKGYDPEEYVFLNNEFDDWKSKVIIDGKSKETFIKDACIITLQKKKAITQGNTDLYIKLTTALQTTLDKANLTPKLQDANDKANEIPLGQMIQRFEKERPIPEPLDEWKDVDGIVRMFTIYFMGHLCKMLGIRNKAAKMYEEEMAKYRVEIPELEDCDDDEVFNHIFNNNED